MTKIIEAYQNTLKELCLAAMRMPRGSRAQVKLGRVAEAATTPVFGNQEDTAPMKINGQWMEMYCPYLGMTEITKSKTLMMQIALAKHLMSYIGNNNNNVSR